MEDSGEQIDLCSTKGVGPVLTNLETRILTEFTGEPPAFKTELIFKPITRITTFQVIIIGK
jgi:hypothetical protein